MLGATILDVISSAPAVILHGRGIQLPQLQLWQISKSHIASACGNHDCGCQINAIQAQWELWFNYSLLFGYPSLQVIQGDQRSWTSAACIWWTALCTAAGPSWFTVLTLKIKLVNLLKYTVDKSRFFFNIISMLQVCIVIVQAVLDTIRIFYYHLPEV